MIARAPTTSALNPRAGWLSVILWSAYLACSWTWCIGMFLPVLLVRDYGIMGWVVFAIPNVIGAAAMGWVLRDGMSERIVEGHPSAIEAFRLVTVVFQLWFLVACLMPPMGNNSLLVPSEARLAIIAALLAGLCLGLDHRLGAIVWIGSIACAVLAYSRGGLQLPAGEVHSSSTGLLWIAPVCSFGFALCPYLDPTFHQARQANQAKHARTAFSIGFGILFLAMIAFTLLYADWANLMVSNRGGLANAGAVFIAVHIGLQLTYTCTVHARATPGSGPWSAARIAFAMVLAGVAALATAYAPDYAGLQAREVVYRSFMAFYGLVFPAYVWLCMVPFGRHSATTEVAAIAPRSFDRRRFRLFFLTVGIAAPFYWMGFIERQELWLAPGLGIVLIARLFVRPRGR